MALTFAQHKERNHVRALLLERRWVFRHLKDLPTGEMRLYIISPGQRGDDAVAYRKVIHLSLAGDIQKVSSVSVVDAGFCYDWMMTIAPLAAWDRFTP